MQLLMLTGFFL